MFYSVLETSSAPYSLKEDLKKWNHKTSRGNLVNIHLISQWEGFSKHENKGRNENRKGAIF